MGYIEKQRGKYRARYRDPLGLDGTNAGSDAGRTAPHLRNVVGRSGDAQGQPASWSGLNRPSVESINDAGTLGRIPLSRRLHD